MSDAPPTPASRRGWLTPRRLAVLLGVWVLAVGGALLLARALDDPVDQGARDEAQAVAPGPVAAPGASTGRRRPGPAAPGARARPPPCRPALSDSRRSARPSSCGPARVLARRRTARRRVALGLGAAAAGRPGAGPARLPRRRSERAPGDLSPPGSGSPWSRARRADAGRRARPPASPRSPGAPGQPARARSTRGWLAIYRRPGGAGRGGVEAHHRPRCRHAPGPDGRGPPRAARRSGRDPAEPGDPLRPELHRLRTPALTDA